MTKRKLGGSLLTHLLILLLLVFLGWKLYEVRAQVQQAQAERDAVSAQVEKTQQGNDVLRQEIEEGATEDKMEEIARDDLGLVEPNEYVFYDKQK
ncbi:MAG: septum formation initiator family protein [Oscillibacter sp.]|nr:septum formation initiator family protein [Oscillibacter sp.]